MTEKQKIFADEYLIDLNATRAYRVAYSSVKKEKTTAQAGTRSHCFFQGNRLCDCTQWDRFY